MGLKLLLALELVSKDTNSNLRAWRRFKDVPNQNCLITCSFQILFVLFLAILPMYDSLLTLTGSLSIVYCKWERLQGKEHFHHYKTAQSYIQTVQKHCICEKKMVDNQNPAL